MESVIYTLFLVGILQAAFCAIFLLSRPNREMIDLLFILLMIAISWPLLMKTAADSGFYPPRLEAFKLLPAFFGPLGYLCLTATIHRRLTWSDLLHLIPALLIWGWAIVFNLDLPPHEPGRRPEPGPPPPLHIVPMLGVPLVALAYGLLGFKLLRTSKAKQHPANTFLMIFNLALLLQLLIPILQGFSMARRHGPVPVGFVFLVMEYVVSLCALKIRLSPEALSYFPAAADASEENGADRGQGKYEKTGLSDSETKQLTGKLVEYMERDKPFLDDSFDVQALANGLNVSRHHISQVLSQGLGKNFYSYVNELRIAEVQRQMVDPEYTEHNIFRIAMSCGFNSKSTFNSVFKNITGLTPNEYRQRFAPPGKEVS
ncbi:MAG: helix-turn-helix transcriptional regulator [Spirochaetia bacterium]|nr:helix-turn-helix transcriptional regulator [Spirochaetia bacterium]